MQLFCGEQRKAFFQIKPHLVAEHAQCSGSGAVVFLHSFRPDAVEKIKVLFHLSFVGLFLQR